MMIRPTTPNDSNSVTTHNCPSCSHENSEVAKFCAECAAPLKESTEPASTQPATSSAPTTPQTPPRPPQQPNSATPSFGTPQFGGQFGGAPRSGFGMPTGGGSGSKHRLGMDAETAFQQLLAVIQANHGEVTWQTGPHSANFRCIKKVFLSPKMKFEGELSVTPVSEQESIASIDLKPDWGNLMGNAMFTLVCCISMVVLNPMFLPLFMLIAIASVGYAAWSQMVQVPGKLVENFLKSIPKANAVGGFGVAGQPFQPTPVAPARPAFGGDFAARIMDKLPPSATAMINRVAPNATTAASAATPPVLPTVPTVAPVPPVTKSPVERIKELASLKEVGAITEEEFETKKAELLKAI